MGIFAPDAVGQGRTQGGLLGVLSDCNINCQYKLKTQKIKNFFKKSITAVIHAITRHTIIARQGRTQGSVLDV